MCVCVYIYTYGGYILSIRSDVVEAVQTPQACGRLSRASIRVRVGRVVLPPSSDVHLGGGEQA
jgi:hypothetical protein